MHTYKVLIKIMFHCVWINTKINKSYKATYDACMLEYQQITFKV